jgi:hypothetical protein
MLPNNWYSFVVNYDDLYCSDHDIFVFILLSLRIRKMVHIVRKVFKLKCLEKLLFHIDKIKFRILLILKDISLYTLMFFVILKGYLFANKNFIL